MKSKDKKHGNRRYQFNENFFEKIDSEEKAYWLGFLYADGNTYTDGRKMHHITIKLAVKDLNHLMKFQKSINSNHNIKFRETYKKFPTGHSGTYKSCMLRITSVKMFNDLILLGCVPNKSLILRFPKKPVVKNNLIRHFIRGYFDGDGSVSITGKVKQFALLGNLEFLKEVQKIFNKFGLSNTKITRQSKAYSLRYGGNINIEKIKKCLYKNANIFLNRKKEIFDLPTEKISRLGKLNPSYNGEVIKLKNIYTNNTFEGTRNDFIAKYKDSKIYSVISGQRKSCKGWSKL